MTVQVVRSQPITAQRGMISEHKTSLDGWITEQMYLCGHITIIIKIKMRITIMKQKLYNNKKNMSFVKGSIPNP